jgi:hypothetical protein
MVIRSSSAKEIEKLVAQLREGSPTARDAAVARLRVIGARAVDRLASLARTGADAASRAAALTALEGIDDPRARTVAMESFGDPDPAVALRAVAAASRWVATAPEILDALAALSLDRGRDAALRLAALDAIAALPRGIVQPLWQQLGDEEPCIAGRRAPAPGEEAPAHDSPAAIRDWLAVRGRNAPLSEIHRAIVQAREKERMEPSARKRQDWTAVRGAAHAVLANRGSRVALYDLRETFDAAPGALPADYVHAATHIGDASCLEPLARAWAASRDVPWRGLLSAAARTIAARNKLTGRHAVVRRVRERFPEFL